MKRLSMIFVVLMVVLTACAPAAPAPTTTLTTAATQQLTSTEIQTLTPTPGVPDTSASAITLPPSSMDGINSQTQFYGGGADPNMITLGPKEGGLQGRPYPSKLGMEFEVKDKTPILAPLDMEFIGFQNLSAKIRSGQPHTPYNDLFLCFKSTDPDWPGLIFCIYHLYTSPLLQGHNIDPACSEIEIWGTFQQSRGMRYYPQNEGSTDKNYQPCKDLIGKQLKRGELIAFAGRVGDHSMAPVMFKVPYNKENPTVQQGSNKFLHWVQPGLFFYWKCYAPDAFFPSGVLAYPFECDGYQLPSEQRNVDFKYGADN